MHRVLALIGLLAALCVQLPAWSQDGRLKVSVSHSGVDSVGKQFAYAVREAIRASNGYQLVSSSEGSGLQVNIITLDPESSANSGSYWTAASISYTMANFIPFQKGNPQTWYPIYLTSQAMTIGSKRTDEQARSVMATLDGALEEFRRDAKK